MNHNENKISGVDNTPEIPFSLLFLNFIILLSIGLILIALWQGPKTLAYLSSLFSTLKIARDILFGLLGAFLFLAYVFITSHLGLLKFPLTEYTKIILKIIDKPLGPTTIALGAALSEEILFRAAILGILATFFSAPFAILISALIFFLLHIPQYKGHTHTNTLVFAIGLFLGWLFLWTGTLWAPIIAHGIYNFMVAIFIRRGWLSF